jgi:hypothetical protein
MQSSIWFIFNIQGYTRGMYTYISYTSDLQRGDNEKDGALGIWRNSALMCFGRFPKQTGFAFIFESVTFAVDTYDR